MLAMEDAVVIIRVRTGLGPRLASTLGVGGTEENPRVSLRAHSVILSCEFPDVGPQPVLVT